MRTSTGWQGVFGLLRKGLSKILSASISLLYRLRYQAVSDPDKVIIADPTEINFYRDRPKRGTSRNKMSIGGRRFKIEGGDWDKKVLKIADHFRYRGLVERFVHGLPWRETVIFQMEVAKKRNSDFAANLATFNVKCARRDSLFESIRKYGVLHSSELSEDFRQAFDQNSRRNVIVNIGRDGMLIFTRKGWHRLCIAKILGLRSLPVEIDLRHRSWQAIREEVHRSRCYADLSERARTYLGHPDLEDLMPLDWLGTRSKGKAIDPTPKAASGS